MHARPSLRVPLPLLHPGQTVLHGHGKADGNRDEVTAGQRAGKGQMDVSSGWQWCGRCVEAENDTKKNWKKINAAYLDIIIWVARLSRSNPPAL